MGISAQDEGVIKYVVDQLIDDANFVVGVVLNSTNVGLLKLGAAAWRGGNLAHRTVIDTLVRN